MTYDLDQIKDKLKEKFGENDDFLLAYERGDFKKGLSKLITTNILSKRDESDLYILYFDNDGIYISNISESLEDEFVVINWNKINFVNLIEKKKLAFLEISDMEEIFDFEILYEGEIFSENKKNLKKLKSNNWNKDESLDNLL